MPKLQCMKIYKNCLLLRLPNFLNMYFQRPIFWKHIYVLKAYFLKAYLWKRVLQTCIFPKGVFQKCVFWKNYFWKRSASLLTISLLCFLKFKRFVGANKQIFENWNDLKQNFKFSNQAVIKEIANWESGSKVVSF